MKLSELLSKPFKLKGGGFLNLKGFSKRIIDKEISGSNNSNNNVNEFDKLFHLKVPKLSSVYNDYYNPIDPEIISVPQTKLGDFIQNGIDIPIYDPNDDNFYIVLAGIDEVDDSNGVGISIVDNNLNPVLYFVIYYETDQETGESHVYTDNFANISNEDYLFIAPYIIDSIEKMHIDAIKQIMGIEEPQE